ncbi:carbohydrate sulfotransferase 1-like [Glandiceps talaboti]
MTVVKRRVASKSFLVITFLCFFVIAVYWTASITQNTFFPSEDLGNEVLTYKNLNTGAVAHQRNGQGTNLLIFALKRSGSSVTGTLFAKHTNFFYFYEPDMIVANNVLGGFAREDFESMEMIRPQLMGFLDAIYTCNFTKHEYFISDINEITLFWRQGNFPFQPPITIEDMTKLCRSKDYIATKVLRIYNILWIAPLLRKHNIKVIHLVRDPRGLIKSREMFEMSSRNFFEKDKLNFTDRLKKELVNYCKWMDTNYMVARYGPDWLRNNYLLVRYEDIADNPWAVIPQMYKFIGVQSNDVVHDIIAKVTSKKSGNAQAWRQGVTYENVMDMQACCPERIWKMFGYKLVSSAEMLANTKISLVEDMPADRQEFEDINLNN